MAKIQNQNLAKRPPVVVVLGHIDHGKTSLLDAIRKTQVAEKESGGITQHVGAYQVEKDGKKITFLDTPGHEAFSQMRSRGAKVADIAVLVVAAEEGIKPQTKEAILHIKKAAIPLIVALNKIDKPQSNPERVKGELQKEGVVVEDFGGKVPSVKTSAKTGQGIDELLEVILLLAEMENLKADNSKPAEGVIVESYMDSQRGPMATLLVEQGILKVGDFSATPSGLGKIKILEDFRGEKIEQAFPSQPALVIGFENVPGVGENFKTFSDSEEAKKYLKPTDKKVPEVLDVEEGVKVLNLILKADVAGSLEAIEEILKSLPQEKVILRILTSDVGEINENDVQLAKSGKGLILGFRVKANSIAKNLAQKDKVRILNFEIIYDLVEGVRKFMEKILEMETVRTDLGKLKVLVHFWAEKNRQIIGGRIIEGMVKKGTLIEAFRGEELIAKGRMINLQKNKKDIEKAAKGEEVGILFEGSGKIAESDILVIYTQERQKGVL